MPPVREFSNAIINPPSRYKRPKAPYKYRKNKYLDKGKEYDEKLWKEYFNSGTTNSSRIPVVTPNWEHWIVKPFQNLLIETGTFSRVKLEATRYYMAVITDAYPNKVWFIDNNNMSHQGTIPEHLRHLYTPNGIYLSPMEWKLFQDRKTVTSDEIKNMINNAII